MCLFAAAMFVATFMYTLLASPTAHAADGTWNGNSIMYGGNEYVKIADAKPGDSHGLPSGTHIYAYVQPATSSPGSPVAKAHLIYFAPGTDPPKATSAAYAVYNFTAPSAYSSPSGQATISLTPQSTASAGTTSCDSTFTFGIGWIVCPVTNFLASAMDWLFGILSSFLAVRPVQTNQENALFRAWSYMRNFANVAFVIGFLIIIYSQITNIGLSNYNVKKMLPRLIIAAILVNISYWTCTLAVDISNILGYSIQDIFISMRNGLVGTEGNSWDVVSWKSVSGFILSGGTAAAAAGVGVYGLLLSAGTVGGALYMLLPILVGVIVAALVALLIMAARQAIITILIIISPLAFVAFLLPNTDKYFKKWQDLGMTMLLMFPIFSIIFGGSQLAGIVIIQNADSINLIILGMAVQVAPVVITPLIVRFSGSLLARIGGVINNPSKGLIDRTRKWSEEKRDQRKAERFASPLNRRRDGVARLARNIDTNRRTREGWQKANESIADANWAGTQAYSDIQQRTMQAALMQERADTNTQKRFEDAKATNAAIQDLDVNARAAKLRLDLSKARVEANWEEIKAGDSRNMVTPDGLSAHALANYAHTRNSLAQAIRNDAIDTTVEARRSHSAQEVQKKQRTDDLLQNTRQIDGKTLRDYAGGIAGTVGSESTLASAVAEYRKEYNDRIQEKEQLIKHFNLSSDQRQTLALGDDVATEKNGVRYTFAATDDYAREAAIDDQLKTGSFKQIEAIIKESGKTTVGGVEVKGRTADFATSISQAIQPSGLDKKAVFLGSKTIDDIAQGKVYGDEGLDAAVRYNIVQGKVKDEVLAGMDALAITRMVNVAETQESQVPPHELAAFRTHREELQHSAYRILNTDILSQRASTTAKEVLQGFAVKPPDAP
jgi:hypothetical protein